MKLNAPAQGFLAHPQFTGALVVNSRQLYQNYDQCDTDDA
jgi:hypothetical protein